MIWKINFTKGADREFTKLPRNIKLLITKYIEGKIQKSPRDYGKALVATSKVKLWRYRIENYRLICQIQDAEVVVLVMRIAKRDSVYMRWPNLSRLEIRNYEIQFAT